MKIDWVSWMRSLAGVSKQDPLSPLPQTEIHTKIFGVQMSLICFDYKTDS